MIYLNGTQDVMCILSISLIFVFSAVSCTTKIKSRHAADAAKNKSWQINYVQHPKSIEKCGHIENYHRSPGCACRMRQNIPTQVVTNIQGLPNDSSTGWFAAGNARTRRMKEGRDGSWSSNNNNRAAYNHYYYKLFTTILLFYWLSSYYFLISSKKN